MKSCTKCGKQLSDDVVFCTECGTNLGEPQELHIIQENSAADSASPENNGAFKFDHILKLNRYIDSYGAALLNKRLSLVVIITGAMISIFGFLICALLIGALNAYLIYRDYKQNHKLNVNMCIWSVAALAVWLFIYF